MYRCDKCHVPPHVKVTRHYRKTCFRLSQARLRPGGRPGQDRRPVSTVCVWLDTLPARTGMDSSPCHRMMVTGHRRTWVLADQ